jgi:hypothetical protein
MTRVGWRIVPVFSQTALNTDGAHAHTDGAMLSRIIMPFESKFTPPNEDFGRD